MLILLGDYSCVCIPGSATGAAAANPTKTAVRGYFILTLKRIRPAYGREEEKKSKRNLY
jgi:hypothetical protein